ncbi:putative protein transport protein [Clavispora lusitaniae]|uniref:Uncharacterized protein n=1 Tax=Clavispora lusitaniae TaxID=36911 RepID=A0ACD0WHE2_CLALS|nr:hypothetical protein E0198_001495 [Clavispora lusitaniae]QFZ26710.1 putative protein transport protein [Clavispora lusitaniae]QFZ32378.1 putative protein transport protein [Clavispora lusitaniae]QFZ38047.1 putative protein transport protein [Clavispora lusitaniae]QFZ43730.1 putative protein transport protein [Clavispora lusitaniae]
MDYINTNFVFLRDLEEIDAHINALSEQKLNITKAIKAKTNARNLNGPDAAQCEALVHAVQDLSGSESIEAVDQLVKNFGDVKILREIRGALQKKLELERENAVLIRAADIESRLNQLSESSPVEEFNAASIAISDIHDESLEKTLRSQLKLVSEPRKAVLQAELTKALEKVKWLAPHEKVTIPAADFKLISSKFTELVDLEALNSIPEYPESWFALQVLLHPFILRFNYHFNQNTETNKISRPEWALNYVETFFSDNHAVLELAIGDAFSKHNRIGIFEVLTAILIPLRDKLTQMLSIINTNIEKSSSEGDTAALDRDGRLLSHLIFETASFDQRLRKNYKYNPFIEVSLAARPHKWAGLTGDILATDGSESSAVNNWLNLEFRLAKSRFETDIVGASNAFEIDYEFNASSDNPSDVLKPSYSAFALVKLFDNLTTHFKSLSIVKYQLKYVSKIQLVLLDDYYNALEKEFRQFNESLSSKLISNFLSGTIKPDSNNAAQTIATNGLKGLEILTGLYCSIKFVIESMEDWSTELVYIQLWNMFCSLSDTKDRDNSIFGATIVQYHGLLDKVIEKYTDFFRREIRGTLKEYVNSCSWIIDDDMKKNNQPSTQLSNFILILPSYMSFLKRSLPELDYFLVSSKVCDSYARVLQEYVISNNQFNKNGLSQLKVDLECLSSYMADYLLMSTNYKYSNIENRNYKRLMQSVKMMEHFDATTAKLLKRNPDSNNDIRAEFTDGLDCLSDNDLRDLLFRIV